MSKKIASDKTTSPKASKRATTKKVTSDNNISDKNTTDKAIIDNATIDKAISDKPITGNAAKSDNKGLYTDSGMGGYATLAQGKISQRSTIDNINIIRRQHSTVVNICGVEFKNPIIAASGTFGFGDEFGKIYDINVLGGIALKGITPSKRQGNDGIRIAETASGIINSVGLQNPGVDEFVRDYCPRVTKLDTVLIANIAGGQIDDYLQIVDKLNPIDIDMLELNISCPNVKEGGVAHGAQPSSVAKIVREVKAHCRKPLIVKLSPNVASIVDCAIAAEQNGADALSLINTVHALAVDINRRCVVVKGGLSGRAIKPIGLRMVYDTYKAVKIPIIGIGGIASASDVIEYMMCGARAVQVGTANFTDLLACPTIIDGVEQYLVDNGIKDINDIVGVIQ